MGLSGVIFVVLVAGWLACLVPMLLRNHSEAPVRQGDPFAGPVRLIHRAAAETPAEEADGDWRDVSTPLTRRAKLADLRRRQRRMAALRRRVLLMLVLTIGVLAVTSALRWTPAWSAAVPATALLLFVAGSRVSTLVRRKEADAAYEAIVFGDEEPTVSLAVDRGERDVDLSAPIYTGSLWAPVPVTAPTYVQKPLAARTVRTIDLSAPVPAQPPTADRPAGAVGARAEAGQAPAADGESERPRAVGE